MKIILLLRQLIQLGYQVKYHGKRDSLIIQDQANDILEPYGYKLEEKYLKPLKHYAIGLRITNLWFSTLRGYSCTDKEILAGRYLGALTPLFDALFDDQELNAKDIRDAISSQNTDNETIILLRAFRDLLLDNVKNPLVVEKYLQQIIDSQIDSLSQKNPDITYDEIRRISFNKGGVALQGCRSILDHSMDEKEEEAVHQLGSLVQLTNDVFDVWEDTRKGIKTMVDGIPDLAGFRTEYQNLIISFFRKCEHLTYKKANRCKFYTQMMLIISRGLVCLDYLEKSQEDNNGVFDPQNMSRKQLICDMEKPSNFLKSLKYTLKYKDLFIS